MGSIEDCMLTCLLAVLMNIGGWESWSNSSAQDISGPKWRQAEATLVDLSWYLLQVAGSLRELGLKPFEIEASLFLDIHI